MACLSCFRKTVDCKVSRDTLSGKSSAWKGRGYELQILCKTNEICRVDAPSTTTFTQLAHFGNVSSPKSEVMKTCFTISLTSMEPSEDRCQNLSSNAGGI